MGFNFPDAPTPGTKFGNYSWDGEKWTLSSGSTFTQGGTGAVSRSMQDKAREVLASGFWGGW